jgi:glycine/D-amino acid oxidase-like deaminating enzyme
MSKHYDWIVVGGGITGVALSYELQRSGGKVLLLEAHPIPQGATRYSYGGIPYWSGTTPLTRQLCEESITIHRQLSAELEMDTEFRELPLLLTIDLLDDPVAMASHYGNCTQSPLLLGVSSACALEPLLNPKAINGAIKFDHAQVNPLSLLHAYGQAWQRLGGEYICDRVLTLRYDHKRIVGVNTRTDYYTGAGVIICAGGYTRGLLAQHQIPCRIYFTHAELIEVPSADAQLQTMVLPAHTKREELEASCSNLIADQNWDAVGLELMPASIDAGAVQFRDGTIRMGQLSRVLTDPDATIDREQSESQIRRAVERILPTIGRLKGNWYHCLVAFTCDGLPLVGQVPHQSGLYVFSGFTSPMVYVPPLAKRFAHFLTHGQDPLIPQLALDRYMN